MKNKIRPIRVESRVKMEEKSPLLGITFELLLLFTGLIGYLFCNTTALDMNIPIPLVLLIAALSLGAMILLVWYKRVFFGVLGGLTGLTLMAFPVTFPMLRSMGRSLEVCYNYTVYLLASQPNYSDYKDHLTMQIEDVIATPLILQRHFYSAIILVAIIASVFFALAFFRRIPPILSFLVPMAGLIPYFLYGIVPHFAAFSIFLSAVIGCYGQSAIRHIAQIKRQKGIKKEKIPKQTNAQRLDFAARSGSFGIVVTAMMLLITMGTATFIYARPIVEMETVRQTIDRLSEDGMNLLFAETYEKNLNVGGYMVEDEKLALEVPRWRRLKVASVFSKTGTPIYLRYRTTTELTTEGWAVPDEKFTENLYSQVDPSFCEYMQYYKYLSLTGGADPLGSGLDAVDSEEKGYIIDSITVRPKYKVSNVLGIPGGVAETSPVSNYTELERVGDTVLVHHDSPRNRSYTYQVTTPALTSNEYLGRFQKTQDAYIRYRHQYSSKDSFLYNELRYSVFVNSRYTDLDYNLGNLIRPKAVELTQNYKTRLEKTQALERYFRENYTYSAARQRLVREDGSVASAYDYINYFLFQNEKKDGYCTLFASSMATMLRSIGIPARVASGYYVEPKMMDLDSFGSELVDNNYHAWVEVYFDGIGWLSFDPTPGFGSEPNYYLLDLADQGLESEFGQEEVMIEEEEIEGIIIYTDVMPEPTIPVEEEELPVTPFPQFVRSNPWVATVIGISLLVILLAGAIWFVLWSHRNALRRVRNLSPAEGVREAYNILLRLMQLRGFGFFAGELLESFACRVDNLEIAPLPMKPILPILQKALYGHLELSEEERGMVADFIEALDRKIFRSANPFKAVWYSATLRMKPKHQKLRWKFE